MSALRLSCVVFAWRLLTSVNSMDMGLSTHNSSRSGSGLYSVKIGVFHVSDSDYVCGGSETKVFYPDANGQFPVVAYAHGMGAGLEHCDSALEKVASFGLTIIAPVTGGSSSGCSHGEEWKDLLHALRFAKAGSHVHHPELGEDRAIWSKVGVWGWSMGGKAVASAVGHAGEYDLNIRAMVSSHGARHGQYITNTPSMYTTGTLDVHCGSPPDRMYSEFKMNTAQHKVYVNLEGGDHTEPCDSGRMNQWVAKFLTCHLAGQHCDAIYEGTFCHAQDYHKCVVVGSAPSPAPRPTPTPTPSPGSCRVGDSVPCPCGGTNCAGNQCCPDGSTCPSASTLFRSCPKPKTEDCLALPFVV